MVSHQGSLSCFIRMVSHQGSLSPGWSVTWVVSHQGSLSPGWSLTISHHGSLSPAWSLTRAVSHLGGLSPGWSLTRAVSHLGGLSPGKPFTRVVSHQGSLSPGWSLTRAVFHQGGLSPGSPLCYYYLNSVDSTCVKKNTVSQASDVALVKSNFVWTLSKSYFGGRKNSNLKQKVTALCWWRFEEENKGCTFLAPCGRQFTSQSVRPLHFSCTTLLIGGCTCSFISHPGGKRWAFCDSTSSSVTPFHANAHSLVVLLYRRGGE